MPEFKDVQFMSAQEKVLVLKAWEKFLKNGCRPEDFTERLYHHLTLHCEFIAHYDRGGFYATYFDTGEATARFFTQFNRTKGCKSVEYRSTSWVTGGNDVEEDYYDINNAMVDVAAKYIPALTVKANQGQKAADIDMAKRLLAKHGLRPAPRRTEGGDNNA